MNTNEFRRHLASIHNVLNSNQRHLYEGSEEPKETEEVEVEEVEVEEVDVEELEERLVVSFLESYFGGELNEDTSDEDITNAIVELNATCNAVNEYFGVTEGLGGAALGAVGGGLVGGPLGAVVGGIAGHKIQKGLKKAEKPTA